MNNTYYVWDGKENSPMMLTYELWRAQEYAEKHRTYVTDSNGFIIFDKRV